MWASICPLALGLPMSMVGLTLTLFLFGSVGDKLSFYSLYHTFLVVERLLIDEKAEFVCNHSVYCLQEIQFFVVCIFLKGILGQGEAYWDVFFYYCKYFI